MSQSEELKKIRERFLAMIAVLMQRLEDVPRMDIRDQIAALSLVDRVLAREKDDDPDRAGSAVRKYAPTFKAANGAGRRTPAAGGDEPEPDSVGDLGADGSEPDESGGDEADAEHTA